MITIQKLPIQTEGKRQVVDITDRVAELLETAGNGLLTATIMHTTAALTTADLDPGTDKDFLTFLKEITPQADWRHPHDPAHAPDHILASLIGPAVQLPVKQGEMQFGSWQRVVLVELDGPRKRTVMVTIITEDTQHE